MNESGSKPNKISIDKGGKVYKRLMNLWLQDKDIELYSTHNEKKFVVAERFNRTLKNKTYKCITSISKNMYINKLDDIVNEYNNTYDRTINTWPVDVKSRR